MPQPQSQPGVPRIILIVGIIVVILMALIFFVVAFARRRRRKSPPIAPKQPTFTPTPPDATMQYDQMRAGYGTPPGALPGYPPPTFTSPHDIYVVTGTQPLTTNRQGEEATASEPSPAWSFPVPVRPSSNQEPRLSACGHLNTSDARYCRTCGMPIAPR